MNSSQQEEKHSYRNIFRATTLFGGVQAYQILINVIRSKFVAVLLGTTGVGLQGLYQSVISLTRSITSLGLSQSAVRDVSEANGSGNQERVGTTVSTLRRLVWFTGLLGTLFVICLSPFLSQLTFGNHDYTVPLIVLSCILLIDQLGSGQTVILQGMRRLKDLAKASAIGSTLGLIVSIPLYYLLGIKGIVPTLILYSVINLTISWLFAKRIPLQKVKLSFKETWRQGKWMMRMGVAMSLSGIFATAVSYVIRTFIMRQSGPESVGLYQAGFAIINTYVGMVFTAIGTDFYPRLAAVNQDDAACRNVISQQGEIATHILAPLLCICILLMPLILKILYSDLFLDAAPFVIWCCPGMMFKLASWLVAFQFIAKAESRLFITTEFVSGSIFLILSLLGYQWKGLVGMGIGFTLNYIFYLVIVFVIAFKRYHFSLSEGFAKAFLIHLGLTICALVSIMSLHSPVKYIICTIVTTISVAYAIYMLNQKTGLLSTLKERIHPGK